MLWHSIIDVSLLLAQLAEPVVYSESKVLSHLSLYVCVCMCVLRVHVNQSGTICLPNLYLSAYIRISLSVSAWLAYVFNNNRCT